MELIKNYLTRFLNKDTNEVIYMRCYDNQVYQYYDSQFNRLSSIPPHLQDIPFQSYEEYSLALKYIDGNTHGLSASNIGLQHTVYDKLDYVIVDKDFPYLSFDNKLYPYKSIADSRILELNLSNRLKSITKYEFNVNYRNRYSK